MTADQITAALAAAGINADRIARPCYVKDDVLGVLRACWDVPGADDIDVALWDNGTANAAAGGGELPARNTAAELVADVRRLLGFAT